MTCAREQIENNGILALRSYSYLITGQEPVLVDTSMPGRANRIVDALSKVGMRPSDIAHIVLTHQDGDHIGNAKRLKELSGATLWAPEEELPYIHGDLKRELAFGKS